MMYKKKNIPVEAVQFRNEPDTIKAVLEFAGDAVVIADNDPEADFYIHTSEGTIKGKEGNYVIKGVNGEFYPCQQDIFIKTYVPVNRNSLTFGEAIELAKTGKLSDYLIGKSIHGRLSVRTRPNLSAEDNIKNLPTF